MLYQPPLRDGAYYFKSGAYGFQPHWHYEIELMYCLSGSFEVRSEGQTHTVSAGEYILISSMLEHNYTPAQGDTSAMVVEFGMGLLGAGFSELACRVFALKPEDEVIKGELLQILSEYEKNEAASGDETASEWRIKARIYEIAARMLTGLEAAKPDSETRAGRLKRITLIQPALDCIAERYASPITLDFAAALTHYEKKSFCRAFKAATGLTFHQYLNMYRIDRACIMLSTNCYAINQVGRLCGVEQAKTFSRLFKQYTGMTPSEYKKTKL